MSCRGNGFIPCIRSRLQFPPIGLYFLFKSESCVTLSSHTAEYCHMLLPGSVYISWYYIRGKCMLGNGHILTCEWQMPPSSRINHDHREVGNQIRWKYRKKHVEVHHLLSSATGLPHTSQDLDHAASPVTLTTTVTKLRNRTCSSVQPTYNWLTLLSLSIIQTFLSISFVHLPFQLHIRPPIPPLLPSN